MISRFQFKSLPQLTWGAFLLFTLLFIGPLRLQAQTSSPMNGPAMGTQDLLKEFYFEFKQGSYLSALNYLKELEATPEQKTFSHYWQGICFNKLQRFDEAIEQFKTVLKLKAYFPDLYYELGQALYASSRPEIALLSFRDSIAKGSKIGLSLYYLGYINQSLGKKEEALKSYQQILKLPENEKKDVLQASMYQVGEIYYAEIDKESNPERFLRDKVLPQYEKARDIDKLSSLAIEINQKIESIIEKYNLVLLKMINGRATIRPRYYLKLSEEVKYDTNVILEANAVQNKAQYKDTSISKTDALARYGFYPNNIMSFFPETRVNYSYHGNRDQGAIYKNDNYLVQPALRTNYEYTLFENRATHVVDFDFAYNARDVYEQKALVFNYRSYTLMLGEKINIIPLGETILRFRKKYFYSYSDLSDSDTNTIAIEQTLTFPAGYTLFIVNTNDWSKVRNDQLNTNTYTLRFDLITPRLKDWFTTTLSFGSSLNNPVHQKESRGLEKMYNPALKLTRGFGKYRLNVKYDYIRNNSKDKTTYDYTKSIYGLEFEYLF
jgi:tetratricopeptide (TPR) repeat protein